MKKPLFVALAVFAFIGVAFAQNWGPGQSPAQTVAGTLQLRDGTIAVVSENQVYYTPALLRFVGFIEGLREGAQVTVDGFVWNNYGSLGLEPVKLTLNGNSYDFQAYNNSNRRWHGHRQGFGRRGRGHHSRDCGGWGGCC